MRDDFKSDRHAALAECFPTDGIEARYRRQREELMETTRRYPRTLSEAFAEWPAPAIERHAPKPSRFGKFVEFIRLYAAYRKYHSARYATRVAYEIAIKGASF